MSANFKSAKNYEFVWNYCFASVFSDCFLPKKATVKVIGVGGSGGNIVEATALNWLNDVNGSRKVMFLALDTDRRALRRLNKKLVWRVPLIVYTKENALLGSKNSRIISNVVGDADLIFVCAGMGGDTGNVYAPVIARFAKEKGIKVVCCITEPFEFERENIAKKATQGIEKLREYADEIKTFPNQELLQSNPEGIAFAKAFSISNSNIATSITDAICENANWLVNKKFSGDNK